VTVTSSADGGSGSLRDAIATAPPGATIDFAISGTIALASGELAIAKDLTIVGPGAQRLTLDGGKARVLSIAAGSTVTLSGLTITNGVAAGVDGTAGTQSGSGGPATGGKGGGILNHGDLTLVEIALVGNTAQGGAGGAGGAADQRPISSFSDPGGSGGAGAGGRGGAIFNDGVLAVLRSEFSSNRALGEDGGAGGAAGPANLASGHDGGTGGNGGNGDGGRGAALFNAGTATIVDSTFDGNSSSGAAGGAGGTGGRGDQGSLRTGNGGPGGNGGNGSGGSGAIDNVGTVTLTFVTAARNASGAGSAGIHGNGGQAGGPEAHDGAPGVDGTATGADGANLAQNGTTTVRFSILTSPGAGPGCSGSFVSGGANVSFAAADTSCDASLTDPGDRPGVDPGLQPLALVPPGTTRTDAILATSVVHDLVPAAACTSGGGVDQRGIDRTLRPTCDAGAFQLALPTIQVPTLSKWALLLLVSALAGLGIIRLRA
jgi:hypothetical protein